MFTVLLTSNVNASNQTKCLYVSNQKCKIQHTLINLHPNKYSQELHYYSFTFKLYKCVGNHITVNDLSNKVCVPSKAEDLNIHAFNLSYGGLLRSFFCVGDTITPYLKPIKFILET